MSLSKYSITDMEQQKGLFRILIVMSDNIIRNVSEIKEKSALGNVVYKATKILEDMELIEKKPIKDNPNEKRFQITSRGMKVTEHLLEIDKILKEK